jgi:hypothetical protein
MMDQPTAPQLSREHLMHGWGKSLMLGGKTNEDSRVHQNGVQSTLIQTLRFPKGKCQFVNR